MHYRLVERSWRRLADVPQRFFRFQQRCARTQRPDAEIAGPRRAHHQHGGVRECVEYGQQSPVKALFVYNSNPAAVCPNHNDVIRGLLRSDLFTVVHEQFFTDTTHYADILLPATTFFEHNELQSAYGHYYLQVSHQAIDPVGECRSNVDVFRALAQKIGFDDEGFRDSEDNMMDQALESPNPWLTGLTRDRLEREGHVRLNFEPRSFASPDGRGRPSLHDQSNFDLFLPY